MKADSVRDLKQELKAELLHGETALPREFHRFGATRALAAKASQLHTRRPGSVGMALGIAEGKIRGDYCLSVRIQVGGKPGNELAARVVQRTKGECDIRFVRDVRANHSAAWNADLNRLIDDFPAVTYVNCRDVVRDWHDELHPTDSSYELVAGAFSAKL